MAGRIKVVFASLLKPVDEPRMYEKLGRSLAQTYKYDINIIGFATKNLPKDPLITFWPIFNFHRISLARLLAPLKYFKLLLKVKPQLIIGSGTDLLMVSILYKILFGCIIISDLQENYYRNILWSHARPNLFRRIRASYVRLQEILFDRMINQYIVAERCYLIECSFIKKPCLLLENKAIKPLEPIPGKKPHEQPLKLVYTGTIAQSYGIFDVLKLVGAIRDTTEDVILTICGHCPSSRIYQKLLKEARGRPWIKLKISSTPVPHPLILQELHAADFSLIAYQLNPANENCLPTRIWEAIAWKTPMILRQEHPWNHWVQQYDAGFSIDYLNPNFSTLKEKLFHTLYFTKPIPESIYWESQEQEWLTMVEKLPLK